MISWRIHTENRKLNVGDIVAKYFSSANYTQGIGTWQNTKEQSLVIEIIGVASDEEAIEAIAREIQLVNNQQAVLVTAIELLSFKLIS